MELPEGSKLPAGVKQDLEELEYDHWSADSDTLFADFEFPLELVQEGEALELQAMRQFEVFDEVEPTFLTPVQLRAAIPLRWVQSWKCHKVNCRLVAKDLSCKGFIRDKDDMYAATPTFVVVKVLIVVALSFGWGIRCAGVATGFLHAPLVGDPILVLPPPGNATSSAWRLRKAMYGLRQAPHSWQYHICSIY